MRALLDINVIIALLDPDHVFHDRAHRWWAANAKQGWASCPLSENGVVRIMANPAYSRTVRLTPSDLILRLRTFTGHSNHQFWPDDISLFDQAIFASDRIHGANQIADVYLLALAVEHNGRLATFDKNIPLSPVPSAKANNLCLV